MFTVFTKKDLNNFFNTKLYEKMWKDEKLADLKVMESGIAPSSLEETNHQIKYFWDKDYNSYILEKYPTEARYRRFGSLAKTTYYHNGKQYSKTVRLKKRHSSFIHEVNATDVNRHADAYIKNLDQSK
jgi:hypothetical protein